MADVQALILAAGRGSRLGSASHDVPKCLLEIGRRRLIEHQLDALAESGVGPTAVVVGYGGDEVREIVGMRAEYLQNSRWDSTNSLYSFWLAREWVKGEVLVLNSDVLFSRKIVERLLEKNGDAVAFDSTSGGSREHMKVKCRNGRVLHMAKDLPPEDSAGENVGILKLTAPTARRVFECADDLIRGGGEKSWLGSAINAAAEDVRLEAVDVAGLPWAEIDFQVDLARARRETWPAIRREDGIGGSLRPWLRWGGAALLFALALAASPLLSTLIEEPAADWESVPVEGLESTRIRLGDRTQGWWFLPAGGTAEAPVAGPGPVRVESRLLDRPEGDEPYVLELKLDGGDPDYEKLTTRPSGKATHESWSISRKKRVTLEVPPGAHVLQVRLLAPADTDCLIRFRLPESEADE